MLHRGASLIELGRLDLEWMVCIIGVASSTSYISQEDEGCRLGGLLPIAVVWLCAVSLRQAASFAVTLVAFMAPCALAGSAARSRSWQAELDKKDGVPPLHPFAALRLLAGLHHCCCQPALFLRPSLNSPLSCLTSRCRPVGHEGLQVGNVRTYKIGSVDSL